MTEHAPVSALEGVADAVAHLVLEFAGDPDVCLWTLAQERWPQLSDDSLVEAFAEANELIELAVEAYDEGRAA